MSSIIAIVKSIVGQVFALSPEGVRRLLIEGDRLFAGDQVTTGQEGMLSLELSDGRILDLGRDSQWTASDDAPQVAATPSAELSASELQQAISLGLDPTAELEATAAGGAAATGGGGAAGGGHNAVVLDATGEQIQVTVGYATQGLGFAAGGLEEQNALGSDGDATGNASLPLNDAPVLSLTTPATPVEGSAAAGNLISTASATDEDTPQANLVFSLTNNPGGVYAIAANGAVTLTAAGAALVNAGGDLPPVEVTVTDGTTPVAGSVNVPVTSDVNDAPTINAPASINASEDVSQALTGITFADVDAGSAAVSATLSVSAGTLQATGIAGVSVISSGSSSLTLVGSISALNAFIAAANVNYTSASNASGTVNLNIKLDDQGNTGLGGPLTADANTQILIAGVADAPNLLVSNASGNEDSAIALSISAALTDASETLSSVTISGIPAGASLSNASGALSFTGGSITLSASQLSGLSITPPANSDADFTLNVAVSSTDGSSTATSTQTLSVAVNAVADAPSLTIGSATGSSGQPISSLISSTSVGLTQQFYDNTSAVNQSIAANTANVETALEASTATSTGTVTSVGVANLEAGDAYRVSGLIFLEAGTTYTFSGSRDDTFRLEIGGDVVFEQGFNTYGAYSGTYTVTASGYYSLELIAYNGSGPGNFNLNLAAGSSPALAVNTSNFKLYPDANSLDNLSAQHGALVSNGDGGYYPVSFNQGLEDTAIQLSAISAALTDTDLSESLTLSIGAIPVGAVLSDGTLSFTASSGNTTANITGWNLSGLSITPPLNFAGTFTLNVNSHATEGANGDVATATLPLTVTVIGVQDAPIANSDTATTNEDTAVVINVLGNDVDPDGDTLSVTAATSSNGTVLVNADGTLTFTPSSNFSGTATVNYSISDGKGGTTNASVNVTVNPLADAPRLLELEDIIVLAPGNTSISTTAQISQSNLESELGANAGYLDNRFDPSGVNVNDSGNVDVRDGQLTTANYTLAAGSSITFDYSFTNGENVNSEVSNGYNDLVVLVVTDEQGNRQEFLVDSSEEKFPANTSTGSYSFTATTTGNFKFDWLVLNGGDTAKDSTLSLSNTRFNVAGSSSTFGTPIELAILASLADSSETLSVTISGQTAGSRFSAGTDNGNGSWTFTAAQLQDLVLFTPDNYAGSMTLQVTATSTESNNATASVTQSMSVTVAETTNTISGTEGSDRNSSAIAGTTNNDLIHAYAGTDTVNAGNGNDLIYGGAGDDTLNGDAGNDQLYGGVGIDTLNGGDGNDLLIGDAGNDLLFGNAGSDTLRGGLGNDQLTGGADRDVFVWQKGDGGTDSIKDFSLSQDRIDLHDLLQGENDGNILNYLRVDTATSTLQISINGQFNVGGGADLTIKLENGSGGNLNLSSLGNTSTDIVNSLIAGADPIVKVDHS